MKKCTECGATSTTVRKNGIECGKCGYVWGVLQKEAWLRNNKTELTEGYKEYLLHMIESEQVEWVETFIEWCDEEFLLQHGFYYPDIHN